MNLGGLLDETVLKEEPKGEVVEIRPVSIEARRAIEKEIWPNKPEGMSVEEFVQEMSAILADTVSSKGDWYIRLIRYKTIDESDEAFFENLIYVLKEQAQRDKQRVDSAPDAALVQVPEKEPETALEPASPSEAAGPLQTMRDDLLRVLQPSQNLTPWALTDSLNGIFQQSGLSNVKAQVIPAPIEKLSTSEPGVRKKARYMVAVTCGNGFEVTQVDLRHFPGWGWVDPLGVDTPQRTAHNLLKHIVDSMF